MYPLARASARRLPLPLTRSLLSRLPLFSSFFFFLAHICVIYLFPAGVGYLSCPDVDGLLADAGLSMDQVMAMVASVGRQCNTTRSWVWQFSNAKRPW